jgi:hypothetical protein
VRAWGGLDLDVVEDDGGEDHAGDAYEFFADEQAEEGEPHRVLDASADDLAVQEVFEFVDGDEEDEGDEAILGKA